MLLQIALFDIPKLLFHAFNLSEYLAQGFPMPLINFYGLLLGANWAISLFRFQRRQVDATCTAMRMSLLYVTMQSFCEVTYLTHKLR